MRFSSNGRRLAFGLILVLPLAAAAQAAAAPGSVVRYVADVPEGIVTLTSSASLEVTKDVLSITFSTNREGSDAASVQSQLKQALDAALAEAKKAARPEQLTVQTGAFSIAPRYTNKGVVSGWQGSVELTVEGRDMQAIGQLSGRITTLTINRVGYSISRELREKSEAEIAAQAIARYRAKAADYAKQFGYAGYTLREVNVSSVDVPAPMPMMRMRSAAVAMAPADEALPVEPGRGTLSVNVSGTVQLAR